MNKVKRSEVKKTKQPNLWRKRLGSLENPHSWLTANASTSLLLCKSGQVWDPALVCPCKVRNWLRAGPGTVWLPQHLCLLVNIGIEQRHTAAAAGASPLPSLCHLRVNSDHSCWQKVAWKKGVLLPYKKFTSYKGVWYVFFFGFGLFNAKPFIFPPSESCGHPWLNIKLYQQMTLPFQRHSEKYYPHFIDRGDAQNLNDSLSVSYR